MKYLSVLLIASVAGCSAGLGPVGETDQALCAPGFPGQGAVLYSDGSCHFFAGTGATVRHVSLPGGLSIASLSIAATGNALTAIASAPTTPLAWAYGADYMPYWNGGTGLLGDRFQNGDSR